MEESQMKELTREEILLCLDERGLGPKATALLEVCDFRYLPIAGARLDALKNQIRDKIAKDNQRIASPGRAEAWEEGWQAQLEEARTRGFTDDSLVPKFIHHGQAMRICGEYAETLNPRFEADWVRFLRCWFLEKYFGGCEAIWEFGCGTGHNLVAAAEMHPEAKLAGFDFARSAVHLVRQMADARSLPIEAMQFDMLNPNPSLGVPPNTGVFTFGSMEQLGGQVGQMIDWLVQARPKVVVHIEPSEDLYGLSDFDQLAYRFQTKRGYTATLIAFLRRIAETSEIELLKVQRTGVGSLYLEGYNVIIWRPL